MRRTARSAALVTVLAAAGVSLVACSGGDREVSTGGTTTSTEASTSTTGPCPPVGATTDPKSGTGSDVDVSLLTDVRSGSQPCADRVVFEFRDGAPPAYAVAYEPGPFTFGESGEPVTIQGSAFLVVRFPHASGVDLTDPSATPTYTGPESIVPTGLAHVREVRRLEDFEAVLVWVIGLDGTRPFTADVLTGPPRLYLDIG